MLLLNGLLGDECSNKKNIHSAWKKTFIRHQHTEDNWMKSFIVGNLNKPGTQRLCTSVSWIGKANRGNNGHAQLLVVSVTWASSMHRAHVHFYLHHCLFMDLWVLDDTKLCFVSIGEAIKVLFSSEMEKYQQTE